MTIPVCEVFGQARRLAIDTVVERHLAHAPIRVDAGVDDVGPDRVRGAAENGRADDDGVSVVGAARDYQGGAQQAH